MAVTKDVEREPELSDQVQRLVWLLSHFTSLAREKVEKRKKSTMSKVYTAASAIMAAYLIYASLLLTSKFDAFVIIVLWLAVMSFLNWSMNGLGTLVGGISGASQIDSALGRLSALISYASQMLEHQFLHPMDQLMLRVQLAESEDVLKRGLKYASVSSEHDLPEETEFFEALEFEK